MSRGEFLTVYARLEEGVSVEDVRSVFEQRYVDEPFVRVAKQGVMPATQMVRGSNNVVLQVFEDRLPGRVILMATLDNLVKGSSGQALQNFNIMCGLEETTGLEQVALFP